MQTTKQVKSGSPNNIACQKIFSSLKKLKTGHKLESGPYTYYILSFTPEFTLLR